MQFGTARTLSSSSRDLFSHCSTVVLEHFAAATSDTARCRWLALFHLMPRMLLTQAVLHRAGQPERDRRRRRFGRRAQSGSRAPMPPVDHDQRETVFRERCIAFLTGRWSDLLDIPTFARRLTSARSVHRLALDVQELVQAGEYSRGLSRADAAELAEGSESVAAALAALHPPDDHAASAADDLPPLSDFTTDPATHPPLLSRTTFMEICSRRLPRRSAADHAGWRYEHIGWIFRYMSTRVPPSGSPFPSTSPPSGPPADSYRPGRGADALWAAIQQFYRGGIPQSARSWFLGGRLVALRKDGDSPSSRKVRPIAIGSVIGRVVSMIAAAEHREAFAEHLQPPLPGTDDYTRRPTQPDGSPWPIQVGLTSSGLPFLTHSVTAILQHQPTWLDATLDIRNAFNALHRREFFRVITDSYPELLPWISTMYSSPTDLFYRQDGAPPARISSRCGVRQGCPLGAQLFALGLHPLLCRLQSLIGSRGIVIAYADDVHILGPPDVVQEALSALIATTPPPPSPPGTRAVPDCRTAPLGLSLAPGKTTVFGPSLASPATRPALIDQFRHITDRLGDPALPSLERAGRMLRGYGCTALSGHRVLGTPIGTDHFVRAFVTDTIAAATRAIPLLDSLLLHPTPHQSDSLGIFAPDERAALIRSCLHSRTRHLCSSLPPGLTDDLFRTFHSDLLDAYTSSISASVTSAALPSSPLPLIDHRSLISLPLRAGGHGLVPSAPLGAGPFALPDATPPGPASYHDARYYGSWGAVWHYMVSWIPILRDVPSLATISDLPFRASLRGAFRRLAHARDCVASHPSVAVLPEACPIPKPYVRLQDGPHQPSPPLGAASPPDIRPDAPRSLLLHDLDSFHQRALPHATSAASAALAPRDFLILHDSTPSPEGRCRLLDGSVRQGPATWLQRVPVSDRFRFHTPESYCSALALDLLLCPPSLISHPVCAHCALAGRSADHGPYGRHFVQCPHGIRLHSAVHNPTRDALASVLAAALGDSRVISESQGPRGHEAMRLWMRRHGSDLPKQPDIVVLDLDGRGSWTLIDIKTTDVAGPSALATLHTSTTRLSAHTAIAARSLREYFGTPPTPPPGCRFRCVAFVVSTFGSIGSEGQTLLDLVARQTGESLPPSLAAEISWSASTFAGFARQAVTMALRRSLAGSLAGFTHGEAAACAVPDPAPDPVGPVLDPGHVVAVV